MKPLIRFHTAYLGHTGYAAHARGLIRSFKRYFSDYYDIRVRNCSWADDLSYLDDIDFSVIEKISIRQDNQWYDLDSTKMIDKCQTFDNRESNVDIVLLDQQNIYYYSDYNRNSLKVAYLVWESTEIIHDFFKIIKDWNYFLVVTPWHKEVLINHGIDSNKIFIVPEGLNEDILNYRKEKNLPENFTATFFGRWDYRKSLQEILWSFIEEFPYKEYPDFKINISCDNPFAEDGLNFTENRLERYGLNDPRINILGFLSRQEYLDTINNSHVFLNCARAEGWNIPLFEAMSIGTPVTYCDYGAPKFFTENCPGAVKYKYLELASRGHQIKQGPNFPGLYCEPDFDDLKTVLRSIYIKRNDKDFLDEIKHVSIQMKNKWTWFNACESLKSFIDEVLGETYIVVAHCDDEKKIDILDRCIQSIGSSKFFIVSYLDAVEKYKDKWIKIEDNPAKFISNTSEEDVKNFKWPLFNNERNGVVYQDYFYFIHHWSAWNLLKQSLKMINLNPDSICHIVNYDYIVRDLDIHRQSLSRYDAVFYKWRSRIDIEKNVDWGLNMINGAFFSAKFKFITSIYDSLEENAFYQKYSFYEQALSDTIFKQKILSKILDYKTLDKTCMEWDIITRKVFTFYCDDVEIEYCLYQKNDKFFINLYPYSNVKIFINSDHFNLLEKTEYDIEINMPLLIQNSTGSKLMERNDNNVLGRLFSFTDNK